MHPSLHRDSVMIALVVGVVENAHLGLLFLQKTSEVFLVVVWIRIRYVQDGISNLGCFVEFFRHGLFNLHTMLIEFIYRVLHNLPLFTVNFN
jgi:hypothetical protein